MDIDSEHNSSYLPDWITWQGKLVYETLLGNGGYSDERHAKSFAKLFESKNLEVVWRNLAELQISPDGWAFLLAGIALSIDCAPVSGKRATRDTPSDDKIKILERQKSADLLLQKISTTANELSELLWQLDENGGVVPGETYSGLGLIEKTIEQIGMASATGSSSFSYGGHPGC